MYSESTQSILAGLRQNDPRADFSLLENRKSEILNQMSALSDSYEQQMVALRQEEEKLNQAREEIFQLLNPSEPEAPQEPVA